jgi:Maltose acetyltransferase
MTEREKMLAGQLYDASDPELIRMRKRAAKISRPFFFQIERNDIIDAAFSVRYRFAEAGFLVASAAVPLNDDGLPAEVIPTAQVEYQF